GEALRLGLLSTTRRGVFPTSAARAFHATGADVEALTDQLAQVLPAPVEQVIVQADHTIMAPGLLAPEDAQLLAQFAAQESGGMASVWRVSQESLQRAAASGVGMDQVQAFLEARAMGGAAAVPQSLRYLIGDVQRVGAGDPGSRGPVPFVVEAPPQQATGDVEAVIRGAVATIRDAAAEETEGGYEAREPKQMMAMVMEAFHSRAQLRIVYADHGGEQVEDVVAVVMCSPVNIAVSSQVTQKSYSISPHRLFSVALE
ncbi:MAG TPA: helicase-associated domain-containing protein, partial [Candidatus Corynebacterium gallistercoris]|nr:helicase-associated domain-containing protein [Candidatus Corynebacterium gallistercoris]